MAEGYRKDSLPKKSVAMKILSAYGGGVTNVAEGVEYTAFGRDREVLKFNQTLKMTQAQSGRMEAFVGSYGIGKTFILALFQSLATKKGFVVMTADVSKSTWFSGTNSEKQGLQLYRTLIKNTAIKGKGMGAFDTILRKWHDDLAATTNGSPMAIVNEFDRLTSDLWDLPHFNDIRGAILTRFGEYQTEATHSNAMDYFLANFTKKTDAQAVGARDYIHESEWFGVLNTLSHIFVAAGYKGLILLFDQVDFLLNLPKNNRQQNYEALLSMWNDVNEGRTEYLSVCLFAADRLVMDEHKGTATYAALHERLRNATQLTILPPEEMVGLLKRLKAIHEAAYGWESGITEETITKFAQEGLATASITGNCVRPISMAWIKLLDNMEVGQSLSAAEYQEIIQKEVDRTEARDQAEFKGKPEEPVSDDGAKDPSNIEFPDDD